MQVVLQDIEGDRRIRISHNEVIGRRWRLVDSLGYRAGRLGAVGIRDRVGKGVLANETRRWRIGQRAGIERYCSMARIGEPQQRRRPTFKIGIVGEDKWVELILMAGVKGTIQVRRDGRVIGVYRECRRWRVGVDDYRNIRGRRAAVTVGRGVGKMITT